VIRASTTHQTVARAARVAEIRLRIQDGTYETPDKLERAVEALLDRVGRPLFAAPSDPTGPGGGTSLPD